MQSRAREPYKELCEHAEVVDDPGKLQKLSEQINRILKSEVAPLAAVLRGARVRAVFQYAWRNVWSKRGQHAAMDTKVRRLQL